VVLLFKFVNINRLSFIFMTILAAISYLFPPIG